MPPPPFEGVLVGTLPTFRVELSYRKQIACQLRTQYVEGIKSRDLEI